MSDSRSDEQLMGAYVAGDGAAFRVIFERYAPLLLRAMLRELYVREEANDLVQQTFLQLHRARADFDPAQKLKPWVFTIALNLKREYFRKKKRRPERSLDAESAVEPAVAALGAAQVDARRTLARVLDDLPPDQREVIELHWFDGLEFPEVAQVVGASVSAVKVRAHRGYVRLRQALGDDAPLPALGGDAPGGNRNQAGSI
ncbi:MAG TPA: RNA polymerase sigma factor [Polyangiaceae bacterium]|nr:RNA polymerase sigma factor [Polyangiaceae bacterium]